jgi:hypothetical protein
VFGSVGRGKCFRKSAIILEDMKGGHSTMVDVMLPPSKIENHALVFTEADASSGSVYGVSSNAQKTELSILLSCTVQLFYRNPNDIDLFGVAQLCIFPRSLVIFT